MILHGMVSLVLMLALPVSAFAGERVDFFSPAGKCTGYTIVDRERGRVDLFDEHSPRRTGRGWVTPSGSVELFDAKGQRTGYAVVDRESGRVDFFDVNSRRTGWGRVDPSGRVERFGLDGKRQGDTVLPLRREDR